MKNIATKDSTVNHSFSWRGMKRYHLNNRILCKHYLEKVILGKQIYKLPDGTASTLTRNPVPGDIPEYVWLSNWIIIMLWFPWIYLEYTAPGVFPQALQLVIKYLDVSFDHTFKNTVAVTWLKYCLYGVKLYPINQSINQKHGIS